MFSTCTKHRIELEPLPSLNFEKTFTGNVTMIEFADSQHGMMVRDGYRVYTTTDGGHTWTVSLQLINSTIVDLDYVSRDTAFAYTLDSPNLYIRRTTDGGQNWPIVYQRIGGTYGCSGHFVDGENGFIWFDGSSNPFQKSLDGGATWNNVSQGNIELNNIFFLNSTLGYSRIQYRQLMKTQNGGVSWNQVLDNYECLDYSVAGYSSYAFAVGDEGVIRRSTDFGTTWSECFNDPESHVEFIDADENGLVVAYGHGAFLLSRNFGGTWEYCALRNAEIIDSYTYYSMCITSSNTIVASGYGDSSYFVGIITLE